MDRATVIAAMRAALGGRALIVVSNREPYVHRRGPEGLTVERPVGGLVAALDPVLQAAGGTWIAWGSGDGDFDVTDPEGRLRVPPGAEAYTLRRVALTRAEVDGYYYGYANQALWPLCHMALAHARFRRRAWEMYRAANAKFAAAVLAEAPEDSVVWVHDYHLALAPRSIRLRGGRQFLMHFWHIPWPAWDVFRACPQRAEILDGLLANDLMAFQHPRHVEHFLECVERELGAQVDRERGLVEYEGGVTRVAAFPISVDFAALTAQAASPEAERWLARLRRRYRLAGRFVGVGVDRLDYTKGIPERLRALERLFQRFPRYRGRLVFMQKCAPSRTQIRAYRDLQRRVESEIDRLNVTYGTADWQPVVYLPRPLPPAGMAALYRLADFCLVSSLQDGMNLVAKEYVACQVDRPGVLLLSELAGAHDELTWALPINPYDASGTAETIVRALEMSPAEKADRMKRLRAVVAERDIYRWMADHLEAARELLTARAAQPWIEDRLEAITAALLAREHLAVLLDFDGTLAPIVPAPEDATLPQAVAEALAVLSRAPAVTVGIVSGRALADVRARVGLPELVYAGNHGLEIAGPRWAWVHPEAQAARGRLRALGETLRARLGGVPGVAIEDKGLTISVHYRRVPQAYVEAIRDAVYDESGRAGGLLVREGKKVLEVAPRTGWHKGAALRLILEREVGEDWANRCAVLYAGDDRTDEEAFRTLPPEAVTIRVGMGAGPTAARYAARDLTAIAHLLRALAARLAASAGAPPSGRGAPSGRA
ncbi:MAG TPA: bifunctional alpha,alpha-trehalose-phosphate synthase (UDP-forming)/trehalose-phosphatase [bacterium]|nr:bifunctional alpha,alpha-trehalose-phosphate synthase (UDP-forming)/trehalose-phosphatase [bacterium]